MKKIIIPLLGLVLWGQCILGQEARHEDHTPHCNHNHHFSTAPIGIMGDHIHDKGSLMFSYRFMWMNMNGNQSETSNIENTDVFSSYMISPQSMAMGMHMLGMMYAPSDRITVMLMGNYISNSMDLKTRMGVEFTTQSGGLGDLNLCSLIKLVNGDKSGLHAIVGIHIPTGSIDQRDDTPAMTNAPLAYPMQLGSGTWDPVVGFNYTRHAKIITWGAQAKYKLRIGENSENYSLGNQFLTTMWGTVEATQNISLSVRANYLHKKSIDGADPDLNPMMMPLFDRVNSGRSQLDVLGGVNLYINDGFFNGVKLGLEAGYPVYQNLTGIQMKRDISITIGLQYAFGG